MYEKDAAILHEMMGASHRAGAIVGAAYLEDRLLDAICAKLVGDKSAIEGLFNPNKPMGTLGAKAQLGYLLGLYSKKTRDEIDAVGWIRNRFAHWATPITFGTKIIRDRVDELQFVTRSMKLHWAEYEPPQLDDKPHAPGYWARFHYAQFVDSLGTHLQAYPGRIP